MKKNFAIVFINTYNAHVFRIDELSFMDVLHIVKRLPDDENYFSYNVKTHKKYGKKRLNIILLNKGMKAWNLKSINM